MWLRSVGIWRFELVARRLAGYAIAMEVARRLEGPEVNRDLRKTVSRCSLVPSRELKRKGYSLVLLRKRHGIKCLIPKREASLLCLQKELKNGRGQNWAKMRTAQEKRAMTVSREFVWVWLCGCDRVGEEGSVWVGQP